VVLELLRAHPPAVAECSVHDLMKLCKQTDCNCRADLAVAWLSESIVQHRSRIDEGTFEPPCKLAGDVKVFLSHVVENAFVQWVKQRSDAATRAEKRRIAKADRSSETDDVHSKKLAAASGSSINLTFSATKSQHKIVPVSSGTLADTGSRSPCTTAFKANRDAIVDGTMFDAVVNMTKSFFLAQLKDATTKTDQVSGMSVPMLTLFAAHSAD